MAKKRPFLTVYTVSSIDDPMRDPMQFDVIGSWPSRGEAIRQCADYILDRMQYRPDIRSAVLQDENHQDLRKKLDKQFEMEWVERVLLHNDDDFNWDDDQGYQDLYKFLFDYMSDEIGGQSCYIIYDGTDTFRFDVTENDVEGTLFDCWTCVTSGKTDNEDEEFEQAFPETFLSQKEALGCALNDLKYYLNDAEPEYIKDIMAEAKDNLKKYGKYCYALNDSAMRRWDVWHTPMLLSGQKPEKCLTTRR